jgi:predicted acylesterase/phospholipase RssA
MTSACTDVAIHAPDRHIKGAILDHQGNLSEEDWKQQGRTNAELLAEYQQLELAYRAESRPGVCLALSGGGIRAAAFSIGVMRGLYQNDDPGQPFLDRISIISGVSGGAYALSWYYMNQVGEKPLTKAQLFGKDGLDYLLKESDFVDVLTVTAAAATDGLLIPWNLFANGVFGWHLNTSGIATSLYEHAITKTFHGGNTATYDELWKVIQKQKLPFFVINATTRIDEDRFHYDSQLSKTVFEISPVRFGSDAMQYSKPGEPFPLEFVEAVEVSGAALDLTQMVAGASQRVVGSALNMDTGRFINNYREPQSFWTLWHFIPFPVYLLPQNTPYYRDAYGDRLYLTDGGYAENLGAWSLVRRNCEQIIIADAEFDENYTFEAYFKLKRALEQEMHVKFDLDKVDTKDLDQIPEMIEQGRSLATRSKEPGPFPDAFNPAQSVFHGSIGVFPYMTNKNEVERRTVDVVYIKMAMDHAKVRTWTAEDQQVLNNKYGPHATKYARASFENRCDVRPTLLANLWPISKFYACQFPHYSTFHQNYSPDQFEAYVDLGQHLVKSFLAYDQSTGKLNVLHRPDTFFTRDGQ